MKNKQAIRMRNGHIKEVVLTRKQAIKVFCTECLGFGAVNPKDCTNIYCSLFRYRGKSQIAYR